MFTEFWQQVTNFIESRINVFLSAFRHFAEPLRKAATLERAAREHRTRISACFFFLREEDNESNKTVLCENCFSKKARFTRVVILQVLHRCVAVSLYELV